MTATIWTVLNPDQDRIVSRSPSLLDAVRLARHHAGSPARLERAPGLGLSVRGVRRCLTVFRVLVDDQPGAPEVIPGRPLAEVIVLPAGGSFIWVPAA